MHAYKRLYFLSSDLSLQLRDETDPGHQIMLVLKVIVESRSFCHFTELLLTGNVK